MPYAQSASWRLVAEINRHRRLANYQYIGLHERDEVWDEARDENEYLTGVRHLQFSLHDRQMCEQAGNVLTCMRNVTRLDVEGHRSASDETNLVTWQLILRMFSVEHELPHLRTLRLKGLRLLHNDGIVPQPPGLRHLEHLQLILCCDYAPFLVMLEETLLMRKSFTLCEGLLEGGTEFDGDADDFLRSMDSLQRLSLILDPNWVGADGTLFEWSTLHAHAAGIKGLKVHCTSQHRQFVLNRDASDFRHFCTKASSLQKLSISGIAIKSNPPIFPAFETGPGSLANVLVCRHSQPRRMLSLTNI